MKRFLAFALVVLMMLSFAACGSGEASSTPNGSSNSSTAGDNTSSKEDPIAELDSGKVTIGNNDFYVGGYIYSGNISNFGTAEDILEGDSCLYGGKDTLYKYADFDIYIAGKDQSLVITYITLKKIGLSTEKGLKVGDNITKAEEIYGTNYTENLSAVTYRINQTMTLILELDDNGYIKTITYNLIVD